MDSSSTFETITEESGESSATGWVTLKINGSTLRLQVEPWITLLDFLRERLDLTGQS